MEAVKNNCEYCDEILGRGVIEHGQSFEELVSECINARPQNVEYNEENKLRTSGIIKWLLQNATEQTIDESDIDKIIDQCVYSEECETIDILKNYGIFIVIQSDVKVKGKVDRVKYAAWKVMWKDSAIYLAVKKGPIEIISWLLNFQVNAKLIVKNKNILNKLLGNAAKFGNLSVIKKLIELGADINHFYHKTTKIGDMFVSVLGIATKQRHYHVVEWLVNNVEFENNILENSLQCAVRFEIYDLIKYFVGLNTVDINYVNFCQENCFHIAARNGNISVLSYLKDLDADLSSGDVTVAHIAAANGYVNILKWYNSQVGFEIFEEWDFTPLYDAAEYGQLESVKYLIHNNFNVNSKTQFGSILHVAVRSGNIEVVKFLVSHGADPLVIDDDQNTLLHDAIRDYTFGIRNNLEIIMHLASYGINLLAKNKDEKTVLHFALIYNEYLVVKWLLDKGMDSNEVVLLAENWVCKCLSSEDFRLLHMCIGFMTDIDQIINGKTLLHMCASNPEAVKILIDKNADVNIKSLANKENTPLMESLSSYSDTEGAAAQILLQHGADVNAISTDGKSALYCAVKNNKNIELIKKLIELGADVNAGNPLREHIILHAAVAYRCDPDIVKCLVEAGANVNCVNSKNETAICLHMYKKKENKWKIVKYLVEKGADVNHYTKKPILFEAIETGDVELVSCLLHHGARTDVVFENEDAILHKCTKISNKEISKIKIVKLLISHGADINCLCIDKKSILLHFITNIEMVDYLIKAGININIGDALGSTVLYYALLEQNFKNNIHDQIKIALKLINHGANINHVDTDGNTPLHLAVANPHCSEVAKLLVKKGADVNAKNKRGNSILHSTCLGDLGIWLISEGANVNATNEEGVTVLQSVLLKFPDHNLKCQNIVNSIVKCSIKYDPIPPTTLASINTSRYIEYIHILIDTVCDVNIKDERGLTALHYVIDTDNVDILDHVVKKGANVLSRTLDGDSVLHLAIRNNKVNIVKYLLKEQNRELLSKHNEANETPVDIAMKKFNIEVMQSLSNYMNAVL